MSPAHTTRRASHRGPLAPLCSALLGAALTTGCAADVDEVSSSASAMLNGTPVTAEGSGFVAVVSGSEIVSGTLIRNQWVLTYLPTLGAASGRTPIRVVMGSQSVWVDQVLTQDGTGWLLHLTTPMTMRGSTTGWRVDLRPGATSSLVGQTLTCYGYGENTLTGGAGTLRTANLRVASFTSLTRGYTLEANALGQLPWRSDVGGPCLLNGQITGINYGLTNSTTTPSLMWQYSVESFREWVTDMLGERAVPGNDARANAIMIGNISAATSLERTVAGTTVGATHDLASSSCNCTSGPDVWYRFFVETRSVVAVDTAGSEFDTSVAITDSAGSPFSAGCNDDARCTTGGFTSTYQSQVALVLDKGAYNVAVGGCGTGRFFLHLQQLQLPGGDTTGLQRLASQAISTPLAGSGVASGTLTGASAWTSTCGGDWSGEDLRWFLSCGGQPQTFSLCRSDGGTYSRQIGSTLFDPVLTMISPRYAGAYVYNGTYPDTNGVASGCNDDAIRSATDDCAGTGGDTFQYGARLRDIPSARGINAIYVDSRGNASGMTYSLAYTVR